MKEEKLGVAIVGLGSYSTSQLANALINSQNCKLSGVVTNTPVKASMWRRKFNLESANIYNYSNFDQIINNSEIDVVYVCVPNSLHTDFVHRAARAKKHVICEKPLGLTSQECREMINVCKENDVKLAVSYRLFYDPYYKFLIEYAHQNRQIVQSIEGALAFTLADSTNWRFQKKMSGGGALMDIGIYGIQAACSIFQKNPVSVLARMDKTKHSIYEQVEESISFQLNFENELKATFHASYNKSENYLVLKTDQNNVRLDRAFSPNGQKISGLDRMIHFSPINQISLQIDDFANSILHDRPISFPGEIGLRDLVIMESIYKSVKSKKTEFITQF